MGILMRCAPLTLVFATACNQLLGTPEIDPGPCDAGAAFGHLAPVGGLDSGFGLRNAQLSRDELTIVFSRLTVVGPTNAPISRHGDLHVAHRDHLGDNFRGAAALDELNTDFDELSASLSDDQQTLYFDRSDRSGRYQIYAAIRSTPAEPFDAGAPIESGDDTRSAVEPFATHDAIFFASLGSNGSASLFTAAGHGTSFVTPRQLTSLESLPGPTAYRNPVVSSDDRTIYFSAPPNNASPQDIWSASRTERDQPFGTPRPVRELNTLSAERPAWLSADHCRLYFTTNRTGQGFELWVAAR